MRTSKRGEGWHLRPWVFSLGLVAGLLFMTSAPAVSAAEQKPKPVKTAGIVVSVQSSQVTIRGDKGELTVRAQEDLTEKVAVGSQVTAWHYVKDGATVLHWLEYQLENSFVPVDEIRPRIKKTILLPSADVPDAEGLFDAIASFLAARLGWYVAPRMLAEEIRDRFQKGRSTMDVINPETGEVDLARYVQTRRELVRHLASETRVDAVLEAHVEQVKVNFRSQVAGWDGVREPVASKTSRTLLFMAVRPLDGHVPAATLVLKLRDPEGKLLWSRRRGFAVLALQQGIGDKFRERPIPEVLQDTPSVEKWLEVTFATFLGSEKVKEAAAAKQ